LADFLRFWGANICGIIGIVGSKNVSFNIFNALRTLQHRGQDSAGMFTLENWSTPHIYKDAGLVAEIFSQEVLNSLKGDVGIGHVRYPTFGDQDRATRKRDAQPTFENISGIAMVHNGNIVNAEQIRKEMATVRRYSQSTCDVVAINHLFIEILSQIAVDKKITKDVAFQALETLMGRLKGSYSVVSVIMDEGFLAFRDPYAIRPLVWGERVENGHRSYAFASETCALDILGYKVLRDVLPGEAIWIDKDLNVTTKVIRQKNSMHCMFEWVYFARPSSSIENRNIYTVRERVGAILAKQLTESGIAGKIDVIAAVPDSGRATAQGLAFELGKPYTEVFDKNRYTGRSFIMPDEKSRVNEIEFKIIPIVYKIRNKSIGIVDDSIVRSATSRKVVKVLREHGAKEVHFIVACPPVKNPCVLGIDMPTRKELAASDKTIEEIRQYIGADTLTYLDIQGLVDSVQLGDSLCMACLNGKYPDNITKEDLLKFESQRDMERTGQPGQKTLLTGYKNES
jgi:amidophosphoribosyltransferase